MFVDVLIQQQVTPSTTQPILESHRVDGLTANLRHIHAIASDQKKP